jgi:formylmethanofuran dehydrogenase subunit E
VGELQEVFAMPPDPEPSSPTAPCGRCGEAKVFAIVDTQEPAYFCISCKALLTLSLTEIAPGK